MESLRLGAHELLERPDPLPAAYRVHGTRAGITLLHPWANRIGTDTFTAAGVRAHVDESTAPGRITRDGHGLVIHGILPREPWSLTRVDDESAEARLHWPAEEAFPFDHRVTVRVTLASGSAHELSLRVDTTVEAVGAGEVPVSFGWHPYLRRGPGATLTLPSLCRIEADEQGLPTGELPRQAAARLGLDGVDFDDGVAGLAPGDEMALHDAGLRAGVRFEAGYPLGQIFAPPDASVLSLEPMTAATNALCRGETPLARPGAPYRASFTVTVAPDGE